MLLGGLARLFARPPERWETYQSHRKRTNTDRVLRTASGRSPVAMSTPALQALGKGLGSPVGTSAPETRPPSQTGLDAPMSPPPSSQRSRAAVAIIHVAVIQDFRWSSGGRLGLVLGRYGPPGAPNPPHPKRPKPPPDHDRKSEITVTCTVDC